MFSNTIEKKKTYENTANVIFGMRITTVFDTNLRNYKFVFNRNDYFSPHNVLLESFSGAPVYGSLPRLTAISNYIREITYNT